MVFSIECINYFNILSIISSDLIISNKYSKLLPTPSIFGQFKKMSNFFQLYVRLRTLLVSYVLREHRSIIFIRILLI